MKLKTVLAHTVPEAMKIVRQTIGDDAVIVSSLRTQTGDVRLVVATDSNTKENDNLNIIDTDKAHDLDPIQTLLTIHHTPELLIQHILQKLSDKNTNDIAHSLGKAFENTFSFAPIDTIKTKRAFLLTGIPASGKTIALVKWAVHAKLQQIRVCVLTLDNKKAGALSGLEAYTNLLNVPLIPTQIENLNNIIQQYRKTHDLILIDSPGLNPWMATDMSLLANINRLCEGVEPILTMPAGLDAIESGEIATSFAKFGCNRLIATRVDTSHIFGNLLNTAHAGNLSFAYYSDNSSVSEPLRPLNTTELTRLIMKTPLSQELFS